MPVGYVIRKAERFFLYRVLALKDSPHRIALGVAVGVFVCWTPTIPFQMILTVLISALLRANKTVGVPFVYISNPVTMGPIFYANFLVGKWIFGGRYKAPHFERVLSVTADTWWDTWWLRLEYWWSATLDVFWPLFLGSVLLAIPLAVASYFLTRRGVVAFRRRRAMKRRRLLAAAARQPDRQPATHKKTTHNQEA